MKYYLDTCIWIDYLENRYDKFKPLGDWALELINKIIRDNSSFIFSDHVIKELENKYSKNELKKFLEFIPKQLIINTKTTKNQAKEAYTLKIKFNIPFGDALHTILARDNQAKLVTRDKHFIELKNIVEIKKPEELI